MTDSEQRQGRDTATTNGHENQRATIPRLMVGSWAGEVAVVEARTGRVCWQHNTGRYIETFAIHGDVAYLAVGSTFAAVKRLDAIRDYFEKARRLRAKLDTPTPLEAHQARDGALLWTHTHPKIKGKLHVEAEDGIVVVANHRHFETDVPPIQVLEGLTGKLLWQVEGSNAQWSNDRLVAVRGGHVYTRLGDHLDDTVTTLDLRTGEPSWQHTWHNPWIFSPNGALIADQRPDDGRPGVLALINARDGTEISSFPTEGVIHQLADDGIAYMDMNYYEDAIWIAALDTRTGEELWRALDVAHDHLALDGAILSYSRIIPGKGNVEVGALDAATGERLWQWQSPGTLSELLRLWGAHRLPVMAWDATKKSVATLREIVWQPWFRLRMPPARFGMPQRKQTTGMRLQGIRQGIAQNVWWPLWREFSQGQWRHPWGLHGANNANWLTARWGMVFLGTWLGLFTLDAASGQLLWHTLPTIDLSDGDPALAP